jgi:hypothetical protein
VAKLVPFRLSITLACTGAAKPPAKIQCPLALKESLKASMVIISSGVPDSDKSSMTKMMNFFNLAFLFGDVCLWQMQHLRFRHEKLLQMDVKKLSPLIKTSVGIAGISIINRNFIGFH